ncbi:HesA/MoeB/ThiF family protein [Endozoicomonas euniceicola]|uniref:Molybdopterin-synthase adenylyltransferase MoeB n=1 Tax=Endozoicomonas euniceicola TaxID=1234143 RepID=A0ABY6GYT3_9GAMM|nr:molybdopterin-synthase adenylyltransferase MoeB [Endozoicomonas euniceicola]UYM17835.1 molybdopterin-synthase adenylyltransferase MoeB [Endozoicomonas euniceicola]
MMNDDQLLRYSRQIMLPQVDIEGQEKLLDSHVLIVGMGGLGCPASIYLAAAGVGQLTIVDPDVVDQTNLQRQIAFSTDDVGQFKVHAAAARISAINPGIQVNTVTTKLNEAALTEIMEQADVVLDATDNFDSRFAINRCSVQASVPLVSGAAIRLNGQLAVFDRWQDNAPCYRCLYSEQEAEELTCSESGILGPVVGTIGTLQALEAIKLITGFGESLSGRIMMFDAQAMQWQTLSLETDPECPVCSGGKAG